MDAANCESNIMSFDRFFEASTGGRVRKRPAAITSERELLAIADKGAEDDGDKGAEDDGRRF